MSPRPTPVSDTDLDVDVDDHPPLPPGVDPTLGYIVQTFERQGHSASRERLDQTQQFTKALDKLGTRFEAKMDAQTTTTVKALQAVAAIVVLTLLILGSIAGAVTYLKFGNFQAGSRPAESAAVDPR